MSRPKCFGRILPWIGAIVGGLLIGMWHPGQSDGFLGSVEAQLLDVRFNLRGPISAPDGIAVVQISDADIARLGGFPLSRVALAEAVDTIAATGASAIAIDLLLVDPRPGDEALADALERAGNSVLALARSLQPTGPTAAVLEDAITRSQFDATVGLSDAFTVNPIGPTAAVAASSRLGHVNFAPEPDGALLRIAAGVTLTTNAGPIHVPTLAMAALRASDPDRFAPLLLRGQDATHSGSVTLGASYVPLDNFGSVPLVFYGSQETVPTWMLGEVEDAELTDQVVFLGLAGTGIDDRHPTPFDAAFPGVEAHATLAANIIENRHLRRDRATWLVDIVLAMATALIALAVSLLMRPSLAIVAATSVVIGLGVILQVAFLAGWWLDGITIVSAFVFWLSMGTILRLMRQQTRAINLARYVSPVLSDALAEGGRLTFEGRTQQAVALFVDIEGSTARSETESPEQTVHFLRRFHEAVARAATSQNGIVEQFIGDGAMIIFGLPEPGPDDAAASLACIAALFEEVTSMEDPIPIRVGAHIGQVRADVLGDTQQRQVAIAGDVVNVASRLQELAKTEGVRVVLSDTLLQASGAETLWSERFELRDLGLQSIRGRQGYLHVWAGPGPVAGAQRHNR